MNNEFVNFNESQNQYCSVKDCEGSSSNENFKFFRLLRDPVW